MAPHLDESEGRGALISGNLDLPCWDHHHPRRLRWIKLVKVTCSASVLPLCNDEKRRSDNGEVEKAAHRQSRRDCTQFGIISMHMNSKLTRYQPRRP